MIKIFLFIVLVVSIHAQVVENDDMTMFEVQRLDRTEYGKKIMDSIQLQLQTTDRADDLIKMLMNAENAIEQAVDDLDKQNQKDIKECDKDEPKLQGAVEKAEDKLKKILTELRAKKPILAAKKPLLKEQQEFKVMILQKMKNVRGLKKDKVAEWKKEREDHDKAQLVIERAKELITSAMDKKGGKSFLQLKNSEKITALTQISQHLERSSQNNEFSTFQSWKQMFQILAKITQSRKVMFDNSSVQAVIDLMESILDSIAESRALEKKDYERMMKQHNKTLEGLQKLLDNCNFKIKTLSNAIAILTKRINNLISNKLETENRIKHKKKVLEDFLAECKAKMERYAKTREFYEDQRAIRSSAIGLLVSKIRVLKKYIRNRTFLL